MLGGGIGIANHEFFIEREYRRAEKIEAGKRRIGSFHDRTIGLAISGPRAGALRGIVLDAERTGGDLERAHLAAAPELDRNPLGPSLGGDDLQVGSRLEDDAVVFQQDVAGPQPGLSGTALSRL